MKSEPRTSRPHRETIGACKLTPCDPAFEKKITKAEEIIRRYRNTLRALAN